MPLLEGGDWTVDQGAPQHARLYGDARQRIFIKVGTGNKAKPVPLRGDMLQDAARHLGIDVSQLPQTWVSLLKGMHAC